MSGAGEPGPSLSVVVPVHDGRQFLARSLPPLLAEIGGALRDVTVVDDGSSDDSGALAEQPGARVVRLPERGGPAAARNAGAAAAGGDALLFVDADVVIQREAPARLREALAEPGVVAAFGSYDDRPPQRNLASLYMNLRHHLVHQRGFGEASTFWAGLGVVRAEAFAAVGGFDATRYPEPSIEDIELGYRLRAAGGRIRLLPDAQGTHLKRWSLRGLWHTDVMRRALPWARLLQEGAHPRADLNLARGERVRAALALGLVAATAAWATGRAPAGLVLVGLVLAAWLAAPLLRLLHARGGLRAAVGGLLLHELYFVYASAVFACARLESALGRASRRQPGGTPP